MVSNYCQSSQQLYLVFLSPSLFEILLEQIQNGASKRTSLALLQSVGGNKSIRWVDNIDLIAGSKDKLTYPTSRFTYHTLIILHGIKDWKEQGHGYHQERKIDTVSIHEITLKERRRPPTLDERNNYQHGNSSTLVASTEWGGYNRCRLVQETFSHCRRSGAALSNNNAASSESSFFDETSVSDTPGFHDRVTMVWKVGLGRKRARVSQAFSPAT